MRACGEFAAWRAGDAGGSRKARARAVRAAGDECGIAGTERAGETGAAEIYDGGRYRADTGGTDSPARACGGETILYGRPAVPVGASGVREPRDFWQRAGAPGGLARAAGVGHYGWASCGTAGTTGAASS